MRIAEAEGIVVFALYSPKVGILCQSLIAPSNVQEAAKLQFPNRIKK
jgi:hypothetical protein